MLDAVLEVAKPIFFATLIIITAYLPLFAFESSGEKLFTPMAFTVGYSLLGALVFAPAAVPMAYLTYIADRKAGKTWKNPVFDWLRWKYDAVLAAHHRLAPNCRVFRTGWRAAALAVVLALTIGREFLPYLDEGSLWVQIEMPAGNLRSKGE